MAKLRLVREDHLNQPATVVGGIVAGLIAAAIAAMPPPYIVKTNTEFNNMSLAEQTNGMLYVVVPD